MHRPHFVDMRQHRPNSPCLRFEAFVTQERIEPDQLAAGAVQAVHFTGEGVARLALEAVGYQQHMRALAEHAARPVLVEAVQRRGNPGAAGPILGGLAAGTGVKKRIGPRAYRRGDFGAVAQSIESGLS